MARNAKPKRPSDGSLSLPLTEPLVVAHHHVECDRHLEVLHRLPEAAECGVVEVAAAPRGDVRREEDADTSVLARADGLLDRPVRVEERDVGDGVEPPAIHLAELDQPAVVGAGVGGGQRGVRHVAFPADPDGGIEQHTVDALAVHHGKPGVRVVAARRAALRVGDLTAGEEPRGVHLDAAQRAELSAQRLERSPVDDQHLVALVVVADPDGSVSVHRIDVAEPGVGRLQHVAIRIHHGSLRLDRHGRLLSPALRAITVPYPERSAGAVGRDRTRGEEVAQWPISFGTCSRRFAWVASRSRTASSRAGTRRRWPRMASPAPDCAPTTRPRPGAAPPSRSSAAPPASTRPRRPRRGTWSPTTTTRSCPPIAPSPTRSTGTTA